MGTIVSLSVGKKLGGQLLSKKNGAFTKFWGQRLKKIVVISA